MQGEITYSRTVNLRSAVQQFKLFNHYFNSANFFSGNNADLTLYPTVCLPEKDEDFPVGEHAWVYGRPSNIACLCFHQVQFFNTSEFFLKGWGKREPVDVDDKNDDKLHEVEVTASLDTLLSSSKKTLFPAQYCALL